MLSTLVAVLCLLSAGAYGHPQSKLMPDYHDHPCVRTCAYDGQPMECRYRFAVETYQTMSRACYDCALGNASDCTRDHCVTGTGFSRNIKTVNRGIPGPGLQVCEGDTLIVDVENYFAMAEAVTIHWHGLLQRYSPHMDGAAFLTQCPILPTASFQYKFVASNPGTHFWHAHTGLQRGEGVFGSLVVRQSPVREPHIDLYDFDLPEHVVVINEWQNKPLIEIYSSFSYGGGHQLSDSIMINGLAPDPTGKLELPSNVFRVEAGKRYRFRVIVTGSLFCPIMVSVDNHSLTLIASDGKPFEPFDVQSFLVYSAERYDFVLTADQPVDSYLFRVEGGGSCFFNNLTAMAVVQYTSSSAGDNKLLQQQQREQQEEQQQKRQWLQMAVPNMKEMMEERERPEMTGRLFNSIPEEKGQLLGDTMDQIVNMNAIVPDDRSLTEKPDHQFVMTFAMREVDNLHFFDPDLYPPGASKVSTFLSTQISRISNKMGPVSLLAQMDEIPQEQFCNETSIGEECDLEWCECIHKVTVRKDEVVEIVFISPAGQGFTHPVHLHGYSFRVVAMERTEAIMSPTLFREMDARGEVKRKLSRAPLKDTVPIVNNGYIIIRFVADNPGVWFAHCHLLFHVEIGMSFALEVLDENGKLPASPPNFPTCGNFKAPGDDVKAETTHHNLGAGNPLRPQEQVNDNDSDSKPLGPVEAFPAWVAPVMVMMGAVIAALLVVVTVLYRQTRMARKGQRLCGSSFPFYNTQSREYAGSGSLDHFSASKKQEHFGLTQSR